METPAVSLITGSITAVVSAIITYFGTRSKIRLDLTYELDTELRKKRLEAYKELWIELKPLARYSREPEVITYEIIKETSGKMRDWYFQPEKGIYLSKASRKPYFNLKEQMQKIIDDDKLKRDPKSVIHDPQLKRLLTEGSRLRASLADDIGARRRPLI
jgi:hypothetical protein